MLLSLFLFPSNNDIFSSKHADEQLLDNLEYVQRLAQEYYLTNIAKE